MSSVPTSVRPRRCDRLRLAALRPRFPTLRRSFGPALVVALAVVLAGCDSGPSGPGALTATASAPSLGGAVLQVEGSGIRGFSGRGSTRVYSAPRQDRPGAHRVLVIAPEPGELTFDIEVDDLGMEGPVVTVVSAADGDNLGMPASRVTVRIER